ncbi:mechanosensitive ion channel family protein [Sulfurimonas sp. SAG-AH-194-I05]|nr:mechanosensitive ion channel family protein [Sulfurimonas sp. SAG-AH-194-I05]
MHLFLFVLSLTVCVHAEAKYDDFITKQLVYTDKLNSKDITTQEIQAILQEQKISYSEALEEIMRNKQKYIDNKNVYYNEMFALKRIIKINTHAGHKYAVLRDEVQLKSYEILASQHAMMSEILVALNDSINEDFSKKLHDILTNYRVKNTKVLKKDYKKYLKSEAISSSLKTAKENIKELYKIIDINTDVLNYLERYENRLYKLNKYTDYHLISTVIMIKNSRFSNTVDPFLDNFGLDVVKLLFILILILIIYIIRLILYAILEKSIKRIESMHVYAKDVLDVTKRPIEFLVLIINIHMVIYVYNDFDSVENVTKAFNMSYGFIFTIFVYKIINVIAVIKLANLDRKNTQVKNDVINVGIKILNFIILILGLLIILHFAGANLTAVLSGLGIGGFAVALAAKDYLANFFGTLTILFSDVFSQGDWIEIEGKEGVVVEIGTRVTTLRTFDNALIAIPNAILANKDVKNWNKRSLGRRIKMNLGVKYDSSSSDIKNAVDQIRTMLDKHPHIATENTEYTYHAKSNSKLVSKADAQGIKKTLLVYLDEFSDSSINILVYCFSKSVEWERWLQTKEDVMHQIMEIFEKNNLEFAFPSMSIYNETTK